MKKIKKILFCFHITADLPSFFRLIIHSRKLSRSKSRKIPPEKFDTFFPLNIRFKDISQTIFLRTYKGDIDIFYEIFYRNIYNLPTLAKDVTVIIDLGANVGLSAIFFLANFPQAEIVCLEPGEDNYKMMLMNLTGQINKRQVRAINAAATALDGKVSFEDGQMHYNGKIIEGGLNNTVALSMPTLFKDYKIENVELMKIDVEGSEKEIFKSNLYWLSAVQNIVIEMHSDEIRDSCLAILKQNRFTVKQINTDPTNKNLFWAKKVNSWAQRT